MKSRFSGGAVAAAALVTCAIVRVASAGETLLTLDGDLALGEPEYVTVPFDVPAGTVEIQIDHDDQSSSNILDWGLFDETGAFRGWGGGNTEPAVVGVHAASRSYTPGAIGAGTWQLAVGKAKIVDDPAHYHVVVHLRDAETLPDETGLRTPYTPSPALATGARWYAGDFHVHSRESGDAQPTLDAMITFAAARGLEFLEVTDHNIVSAQPFFAAAQAASPTLLLIPGEEWTSYHGHANGIGVTSWVDFRTHSGGTTVEDAAAAVRAQGGLFAINHPALHLGSLCIGCDWDYALDPAAIDACEIANGVWLPANAIAFWDALCDEGRHVTPIGGSDDHKGGDMEGFGQSPEGSPTTMVFAAELSASGIVAGVKSGRTVVKMLNPTDPMVDLGADVAPTGDTVTSDHAQLSAAITGATGLTARFVKNGQPMAAVAVDADPFTLALAVDAPSAGEDRYRVEVLEGASTYRTVTSHLWLKRTISGAGGAGGGGGGAGGGGGMMTGGGGAGPGTTAPASTSASTGAGGASSAAAGGDEAATGDDGSCGCVVAGGVDRARGIAGLGLLSLALAACSARRRRR